MSAWRFIKITKGGLKQFAQWAVMERPLMADFVAKVGCCRQAAVNSLSAAGFDPPALTPFTQLQRYAMHRA